MIVAVADTHAVVWYLAADARLSAQAKLFIDETAKNGDEIAVSAVTLIEMVYLVEKGRIFAQQFTRLAQELDNQQSVFVEVPVDLKVARALSRVSATQIPDIPDRIVAATAVLYQVPVISRDGKSNFPASKLSGE